MIKPLPMYDGGLVTGGWSSSFLGFLRPIPVAFRQGRDRRCQFGHYHHNDSPAVSMFWARLVLVHVVGKSIIS